MVLIDILIKVIVKWFGAQWAEFENILNYLATAMPRKFLHIKAIIIKLFKSEQDFTTTIIISKAIIIKLNLQTAVIKAIIYI